MTNKVLVETRGKLKQRRKKLHKAYEQAGEELDMSKIDVFGEKDASGNLAEVRKLIEEIDDLGAKVEELVLHEKGKGLLGAEPVEIPSGGEQRVAKSFGEMFVESGAFKAYAEGGAKNVPAELKISVKTLFETSAGWAPETTRTGRLVLDATRPIQVMDLVPMGSTGQNAVVYMEETTFTNNAAATAEGNTYGESALALTEQSSPVRKITVWIPITDEQLDDVAQVRTYLENRLRFMIRQEIDDQIINGSGVAPNLTGILNVSGLQSRAKGADPTPDAIYKAMVDVMVTGQATPNVVVMNPRDWQDVRLLRTTDGVYIWGNPADTGPDRMWGLPVARAQVLASGTAITGDFANFIEWTERMGITVEISDSHSDYFVNGKQAVRADMRAALPIYRPAAFCEITGL